MKQLITFIFISMSLAFTPASLYAAEKPPSSQIKVESELEKKIRTVASMLRCPVCQGESVYDSHADVAVEMKRLIADKIKAGQSNDEILTYFKDRYGNFILMEPPTEGLHWVIWVFPIFMALLGALFLFQNMKANAQDLEELSLDDFDQDDQSDAPSTDVRDIKELRL